jgi:hypothetical protein
MLQLEVGHAAAAGIDPVELFRKHPGCTGTTHFAPHIGRAETGKMAIIGQDSIDWEACITVRSAGPGGTCSSRSPIRPSGLTLSPHGIAGRLATPALFACD